MLSADAIVRLQDELTRAWHGTADGAGSRNAAPPDPAPRGVGGPGWLDRVARQHRANFDLWHIEDEARAPGASDTALAEIKRRIDCTNQMRNDLTEQLDRALLDWLAPQGLPVETAALNSESPGLIIDRLSIQSLKIYHTLEEADRSDGPHGHGRRNRERFEILREQRSDLAGCLDALWRATVDGTRRFKLYRQMKMYNDPALNPAIYRNPAGGTDC
jgi:uncharacterized protein DUF4254